MKLSTNAIGTTMFAFGVSRVADNPRAVLVSLRSVPRDDELRALHEALRPIDGGNAVRAMTQESERTLAETEYAVTAHNYPEAPVGSRDWCLFWRGWLARSAIPGVESERQE